MGAWSVTPPLLRNRIVRWETSLLCAGSLDVSCHGDHREPLVIVTSWEMKGRTGRCIHGHGSFQKLSLHRPYLRRELGSLGRSQGRNDHFNISPSLNQFGVGSCFEVFDFDLIM